MIIGHNLPECGVFCGSGFGCGGTTMVVAQFGIIGIGRGLLALGSMGKIRPRYSYKLGWSFRLGFNSKYKNNIYS